MPYYDENLVEEIRSRNDIVDVISNYVHLQKKGTQYFGLCPFHSEKTGSFSVDPRKQMYYCFGCHKGGNAITFLMDYENWSFPEALSYLAGKAGITLPEVEMSLDQKRRHARSETIKEILKETGLYYYRMLKSPQGSRAYDYFKGRGLTDDTIKAWGLGYAMGQSSDLYRYLKSKGYSDDLIQASGMVSTKESKGISDRFWNRAMFPIMDPSGKVIAFGGRVMGEGEPKYLNSTETEVFVKRRTFYGMNKARGSRRKGLILCEGYMDVISLHQAGFDNAVAALGTAFTENHAAMLPKYLRDSKLVYLCFDSDGPGQDAILRAIPMLTNVGLTCKVIHMDPYKDPDEFIKAEGAQSFETRIEKAQNSFVFEMDCLRKKYDPNDPTENANFQRQLAIELAIRFPDAMERENYVVAVADRFMIQADLLKQSVNTVGKSEGLIREEKAAEPDPDVIGLSDVHFNKRREDPGVICQRMLLTWLVEEPEVFAQVSRYVGRADFTEELYAEVADEIYGQLERGEQPNAARLITKYVGSDEQDAISEVFNTSAGTFDSKQEREKALADAVYRVKEHFQKANKAADFNEVRERKKQLDELRKVHFVLK